MGAILQIYRDGWTALNSRGEWIDLREATGAEIELAAGEGNRGFWLPYEGAAYYALGARNQTDRLARVVETSACLWCLTEQKLTALENFNPAAATNLACKDQKACTARQLVREVVHFMDTLLYSHPEVDRDQFVVELTTRLQRHSPSSVVPPR